MSDSYPGDAAPDQETLALLNRVGVERDDLGRRLAWHEFQALQRDLRSGTPFGLQVDLGRAPGTIRPPPEMSFEDDEQNGLPVLPVPLGRISWTKRPQDLPVFGILIDEIPIKSLAEFLLPLLTEHHRQPFARLLFLCRDLAPVHVLARYGFVCECVGDTAVEKILRGAANRFGASRFLSLKTGRYLPAVNDPLG